MILYPTWPDIFLRLALTVVAGAVIGLNREVHGHSAGLRTTILVGLAACVTMAHANLLLTTVGKASDSFVNIDVLRLPLGILTGVGFIGGGAIFRRDNLVTGVTTAATLWAITAIGLCFGSGELRLGVIATVFTFLTIWLLRWFETRLPREHRARLVIASPLPGEVPDLAPLLAPSGCKARFLGAQRRSDRADWALAYEVRWRAAETAQLPVDLVGRVGERYAVDCFEMTTAASGHEA